jgi:DNA repair protein RadA/Sms
LKEARKLGFTHAILPERSSAGGGEGLELSTFPDLGSFVGQVFGAG